MNETIVEFARLWGQKEVLTVPFTTEDERISNVLKEYDSDDFLKVLMQWADEFLSLSESNTEQDLVEFFEQKVKTL